ncbi:VOC family protein [Rhodococcus ruber]|uniref:VOC family protein n=1 Tax=Rhodococcus ruber TaxID=1830 RepID=UPI00315D3F69
MEISFQVRDDADLDSAAQRVRDAGVIVETVEKDKVLVDLGRSISFVVPAGPAVRLFADTAVTGPAQGWKAPHWNIPKTLRGTPAPMNLGHVAFCSPDPEVAVTFLTEVLDFGISETISSDDGRKLLSALLYRSNYGQDLAIFPGAQARLHHVAFLQYDESAVVRDAAWLHEDGARIDAWGPTRQSYGRTMSLHFQDPSGTRLELFAGGRFTELHPGFQPVRWTESHLAKALSFYDRAANSDFLEPSL